METETQLSVSASRLKQNLKASMNYRKQLQTQLLKLTGQIQSSKALNTENLHAVQMIQDQVEQLKRQIKFLSQQKNAQAYKIQVVELRVTKSSNQLMLRQKIIKKCENKKKDLTKTLQNIQNKLIQASQNKHEKDLFQQQSNEEQQIQNKKEAFAEQLIKIQKHIRQKKQLISFYKNKQENAKLKISRLDWEMQRWQPSIYEIQKIQPYQLKIESLYREKQKIGLKLTNIKKDILNFTKQISSLALCEGPLKELQEATTTMLRNSKIWLKEAQIISKYCIG